MKKKKGTCSTPGCIRDARPKGEECTPCRASMLGWFKRRPAEVLEYRRKLTMYSARMDEVGDKKL